MPRKPLTLATFLSPTVSLSIHLANLVNRVVFTLRAEVTLSVRLGLPEIDQSLLQVLQAQEPKLRKRTSWELRITLLLKVFSESAWMLVSIGYVSLPRSPISVD